MKLLIDAHLPHRLAYRPREHGHEAIHTLGLPEGNRTTDSAISEVSVRESRIVVTKDTDFVDSLILRRQPYKLLLITTGNIRNRELERILLENLVRVTSALEEHDYIELSRSAVIVHG